MCGSVRYCYKFCRGCPMQFRGSCATSGRGCFLLPRAVLLTSFFLSLWLGVSSCSFFRVAVITLQPLPPLPPYARSSRAAPDKVLSIPSLTSDGGRCSYITGSSSMCSIFFGEVDLSTTSNSWYSITRQKIRHLASRSAGLPIEVWEVDAPTSSRHSADRWR
jgi:hypothetical protein